MKYKDIHLKLEQKKWWSLNNGSEDQKESIAGTIFDYLGVGEAISN